ncbi:hypothetical protein [Mangrovibacter plantisponsor]|uniref:Uncharacterized protein n=1 Tax=Mangrovibacter plantisponsor TaxID=451513 RepID=A0A317Q7I6_9ENTR|nr:hypothetical protein [Mangrovibacter plantisponsor]PWW11660.1 hypothetical protein DES37_102268 [Mangrovibacter plantisponsor]
MTALPVSPSVAENTRFTATALLYSGLAAQIALLLMLSVQESITDAITLVLLLVIAFTGGYLGSRWPVFRQQNWLNRLYYGFLVSAAGMLFLVMALQGAYNWFPLVPGVAISGLGQGIVAMAAANTNRSHPVTMRPLSRTLWKVAGALLSIVVCLHIQGQFSGITGFPYAFALLLDLALLGALYVRITRAEQGA